MTQKALTRYAAKYPESNEVQSLVKALEEKLGLHDKLQDLEEAHKITDQQKRERIAIDRELIRLKMQLHDEVHALESAKSETTHDLTREMQFHSIEMNRENLNLQTSNKDTQIESLKIQRWLAYVAIISLVANMVALAISFHSNMIATSALEEAIEANRINKTGSIKDPTSTDSNN